MWHIFRCQVGIKHPNIYKSMYSRKKIIRYAKDNPCLYANGAEEIIKLMDGWYGRYNDISQLEEPKFVQHMIMSLVNTLLHFCVERGVEDMSIMETLGREAFEMSCKKILGDDFVDQTEGPQPRPDNLSLSMSKEQIEHLRRMLLEGNNPFIDTVFNQSQRVRGDDMYYEVRNPYIIDDTDDDYEIF